ncbi:aldo/keto reductase [Peterkaempfera bronchialis]|uniref:aldo/keto reductase n=1 Tax=Peterkaempfera bronchialis TaxID=2126346 RepID=UPI003C3002A8
METTRLGGPGGIEVSALCLGVMYFSTIVDEATSFALLDRFMEAGGTFVDTSDNYPCWIDGYDGSESELLLGRWLAARGARDRTVVATKVGALPDPRRGTEWPANAEGLGERAVRAAVEGSLRRLGTDRIDLYQTHIEDRTVHLAETVGVLADLAEEGTVGLLGVSNHRADRIAEARALAGDRPRYRAVQQRHSYLRPRPDADFGVQRWADGPILDLVRAEDDLTLLAYSPLLSGSYTRPDRPLPEQYRHPGTRQRLSELRRVAAETGATPHQVVLAWLLRSDPPAIPILGVSTMAQLEEALAAAHLVLDADQLARLDAAGASAVQRE